jgi:hypothetical protein
VSIVLHIQPGEENLRNFCYNTSINQLNELLDSTISERIRVLARTKTHLEAYAIKGKEHTKEMIDYMNSIFDNKGVEIESVIITNVKLPSDVADPLEEKTTYASKNTLERKKQSFELRVINDKEEIDLLRQNKEEEREYEMETAKRTQAMVTKEHEIIKAETSKLLAEIKEKTLAEVNRILAEADLAQQDIKS